MDYLIDSIGAVEGAYMSSRISCPKIVLLLIVDWSVALFTFYRGYCTTVYELAGRFPRNFILPKHHGRV